MHIYNSTIRCSLAVGHVCWTRVKMVEQSGLFRCSSLSSVGEEHLWVRPCLSVCRFFRSPIRKPIVGQQWDPRFPIVGTHCWATIGSHWVLNTLLRNNDLGSHWCKNDRSHMAWRKPSECQYTLKSTSFRSCWLSQIIIIELLVLLLLRNEGIREELQIIDINSRIKDYKINWLQHLERMEQNRIPKLLLNYKPRGRRDQGRPCRRWRTVLKCSLGLILNNFYKKSWSRNRPLKSLIPADDDDDD
jgi:hypothetical protein